MVADSSSRETVKCMMCDSSFARYVGNLCGRTISLCSDCLREYDKKRISKEREFKYRYELWLVEWIGSQRAVKRFDKAQHKLFEGSGNEET